MKHQASYDGIKKIITDHTNLTPDYMDYQQLRFVVLNMRVISLNEDEAKQILTFSKLHD